MHRASPALKPLHLVACPPEMLCAFTCGCSPPFPSLFAPRLFPYKCKHKSCSAANPARWFLHSASHAKFQGLLQSSGSSVTLKATLVCFESVLPKQNKALGGFSPPRTYLVFLVACSCLQGAAVWLDLVTRLWVDGRPLAPCC